MNDRQYSDSMKFIAQPHIIVPLPSGKLAIYIAEGVSRKHIADIKDEELTSFFRNKFTELIKSHNDAKSHEAERQRKAAKAKIPATKGDAQDMLKDLKIDLSNLTI